VILGLVYVPCLNYDDMYIASNRLLATPVRAIRCRFRLLVNSPLIYVNLAITNHSNNNKNNNNTVDLIAVLPTGAVRWLCAMTPQKRSMQNSNKIFEK